AAQALEQRLVAGLDAVDADAGLPGEVGVKGLVRLVVARRVEVQHLFLGEGRRGGGAGQQDGAQEAVKRGSRHRRGVPGRLGWGVASLIKTRTNRNSVDSRMRMVIIRMWGSSERPKAGRGNDEGSGRGRRSPGQHS